LGQRERFERVGYFHLISDFFDFFEKENLLKNPRLFLARAFFVEMG